MKKIHRSLIHHILVEINSHFGFTLASFKALTVLKAKSFGGDACREAYLLETTKGREERWNKERR